MGKNYRMLVNNGYPNHVWNEKLIACENTKCKLLVHSKFAIHGNLESVIDVLFQNPFIRFIFVSVKNRLMSDNVQSTNLQLLELISKVNQLVDKNRNVETTLQQMVDACPEPLSMKVVFNQKKFKSINFHNFAR